MATLTEGNRIGDVVLFEEDQFFSRDEVTIGTAADLTVGAVLGKITATGKYILSAPGAVDGSEDPVAVLLTDADAAAADVPNAVVLSRHSRVARSGLNFHATINDTTKRDTAVAALKAVGIIADA
ncbi:MAG: head decoration protein [Tenericutes bacterium]|nr:MAG: head decoration protein [Mycoplasmatota bacterium]